MKLHLYQAQSGAIVLLVNENYTSLTLEQIKQLDLQYSKLDGFNWNDLIKYYSL